MKKHFLNIKKYQYLLGTLFLFFFSFTPVTQGAVLSLEPSSVNIGIGDSFSVDLFIDTEGEAINAFETGIVFSGAHLMFVDITSADSVIDFWIEKGSESGGVISLSGVKTNGFRSVVDPFGEDTTSAKIATLVFEGRAIGSSLLMLTGSKVLLNDGLGTPTATTNGESIPVRVFSSVAGEDTDVPEGEDDTTDPNDFEVYVEKSPLLPGGGYHLFFQTTDDASDIEYYEVKEGGRDWKRAESPYLLDVHRCPVEVSVKAVDGEGNERIVTTVVPCQSKSNLRDVSIVLLVGLLALIFLLIAIKRRKNKKTN